MVRSVPSEFERRVLNRWTEADEVLATRDDVLACVGHSGDLEFDSRRPYVVALDVGLVNDRCVAIVAHSAKRDGKRHFGGSGRTGSAGKKLFRVRAAPGCFTVTVTRAISRGFEWDGRTPRNGFCRR